MSANRHIRHDLTLDARFVGEHVELQIRSKTLRFDRQKLSDRKKLIAELSAWQPLVSAASRTRADRHIYRLTLRTEHDDLAQVDWEGILNGAASKNVLVVRLSDVQPRVTQRLFDFPARILALGIGHRVADAVAAVLDSRSDYAMVVKSANVSVVERRIESAAWPVVDILHFQSGAGSLLTRTDAEEVGSVRWLLRRCERWQTRLIVIEAPAGKLARLRVAAQTIVACSGPAVFVFDRATFDIHRFYRDLLHDRPLDWIQYDMGGTLFGGAGREEALRFSAVARYLSDPRVVKALRRQAQRRRVSVAYWQSPRMTVERPFVVDVVRASARTVNLSLKKGQVAAEEHPAKYSRFGDVIAANLVDRGYIVSALDSHMESLRRTSFSVSDVADVVTRHALPIAYVLDPHTPTRLEDLIMARLNDVRDSGDRFKFDDHEAHGTLPLAAKVTALRKILRVNRLVQKPSGPRHVNTRFYRTKNDHQLREIPQPNARLAPGEVVHLGIRIGQKDKLLENIGDLVFADESIPWTPEMTGTWIEVALTPIDFDNLGEPVQEFWLPRDGDGPLITFAVRPHAQTAIPGVARLRFTLYHRNNVLQSFRVAAFLDGSKTSGKAMSAALGVAPSKPGDSSAGYLTRLEYSAADPTAASCLPGRTLSIVANESAGEKIFSIKTKAFFSTTINRNIADHVKNVRDELLAASQNKNGEYLYDDDNSGTGDEKELLDRLWPLAEQGWGLYFSILPDPDDQKNAAELLGPGGTIVAAHIDLRQLVAWSLIYDRKIDANHTEHYVKETNTDVPVDQVVCRAAFPDKTGTMPPGDCITNPKCVLSPNAVAERMKKTGHMVCPETVICPRRFWGFMHQIEVPAQQAEPDKATKPMPQVVTASKPAGIVACFNPNLKKFKDHLPSFKGIVTKSGKATLLGALEKRSAIVQSFEDEEPDIVYLYCHAYPSTQDKPNAPDPNLDFGKRQKGEFILVRELAGKKWSHAPLVFLNACDAAGFSADAPSEFITAFVQARHAAAVIGTEVTVWEELATEVALNVLGDFLADKSAGEALLRARRVLLAKYNPLGLVYTLYGSASLHLA